MSAAPLIFLPGKHPKPRTPQIHPGRRTGKPHGTYVTDLAERALGIVLCTLCANKFEPRRYHYYRTKEFKILGRCDACKQHANEAQFFIHESLLGRKHGQCWTPK